MCSEMLSSSNTAGCVEVDGLQEENCSQAQIELTISQNLATKKEPRPSIPCHAVFQKNVWVGCFFSTFKDILVLKMEPKQQDLLLHQKSPP